MSLSFGIAKTTEGRRAAKRWSAKSVVEAGKAETDTTGNKWGNR
jgi:hypothetical protein